MRSKLALFWFVSTVEAQLTCSDEFTIAGFDEINGVYERQSNLYSGDVWYKRTLPTIMYVYRNPHTQGHDNWHFQNQLGDEVTSSKANIFCNF